MILFLLLVFTVLNLPSAAVFADTVPRSGGATKQNVWAQLYSVPPGNPIGQGKNWTFDVVNPTWPFPNSCNGNEEGNEGIKFSLALGDADNLFVGNIWVSYSLHESNHWCQGLNTRGRLSPKFDLKASESSSDCTTKMGRFLLHELNVSRDCQSIHRLALDFVQVCVSNWDAPLFGWVRYFSDLPKNESLVVDEWRKRRERTFAKLFVFPGEIFWGKNLQGLVEDTTPIVEVYISAERHWGPCDPSQMNSFHVQTWGNYSLDHVQVRTQGLLTPGVWYDTSQEQVWMRIEGDSHFCFGNKVTGRFNIRKVEIDPFRCQLTSMALDFVRDPCDDGEYHPTYSSKYPLAKQPPLFGWVRYNSDVAIDTSEADACDVYAIPPAIAPTQNRPSPEPHMAPEPSAPARKGRGVVGQRLLLVTVGALLVGACLGFVSRAEDINRDPVLLLAIVLAGVLGGFVGGLSFAAGYVTVWHLRRQRQETQSYDPVDAGPTTELPNLSHVAAA